MAPAILSLFALSNMDPEGVSVAPNRPVSKLVLGVNPPCPKPFVTEIEEGTDPNIGTSADPPLGFELNAVGVAAGVVALDRLLLRRPASDPNDLFLRSGNRSPGRTTPSSSRSVMDSLQRPPRIAFRKAVAVWFSSSYPDSARKTSAVWLSIVRMISHAGKDMIDRIKLTYIRPRVAPVTPI